MLSETAKNIIVSLSFFALGVTLYMAFLSGASAMRKKGHERRLSLAYAAARLGFVITLGLITEAIVGAPGVPLAWRTYLYIVGLTLAGAGYLGIAVESKKVNR